MNKYKISYTDNYGSEDTGIALYYEDEYFAENENKLKDFIDKNICPEDRRMMPHDKYPRHIQDSLKSKKIN